MFLRYDGLMLIFRTGRFVSISNFVMKTANGVLLPLKTTNSYRDVNVTPTFIRYLQEVKRYQEEAQAFYGDGYCPGNVLWDRRGKNQDERMVVRDLINVKQNGAMLTPNSEKFLAKIIREDCGIPFKFHNLRHTYATILAEKWSTSQIRAATVGTLQVRIYTSVLYACNSKNGRTGYGTAGDRTGASLCFWGSASSVFRVGKESWFQMTGFNHVRIRYPDNSFSDALRQGTQLGNLE